jgi:hypothetical protein
MDLMISVDARVLMASPGSMVAVPKEKENLIVDGRGLDKDVRLTTAIEEKRDDQITVKEMTDGQIIVVGVLENGLGIDRLYPAKRSDSVLVNGLASMHVLEVC